MDDVSGSDIVSGIFDLLKTKVSSDAQAKTVQQSLGVPGTVYGVDEYGRLYLRGAPSSSSVGQISPTLLLVGAGLLATAIFFAIKS